MTGTGQYCGGVNEHDNITTNETKKELLRCLYAKEEIILAFRGGMACGAEEEKRSFKDN